MTIKRVDDLLIRCSAGYSQRIIGTRGRETSYTNLWSTTQHPACTGMMYTPAMPSLPSGVTAYIPMTFSFYSSATLTSFIFGELILLATWNQATNTFTVVNSMPTRTELGTSVPMASSVIVEVDPLGAALAASPGSITVNYVDQDGNSTETSPSQALTASATPASAALLPLKTGDWGVRSLSAGSRSGGASHTGTLNFWGIIPWGMGNTPLTNWPTVEQLINSGSIHRLGAGATFGGFHIASGTAASTGFGWVDFLGDN